MPLLKLPLLAAAGCATTAARVLRVARATLVHADEVHSADAATSQIAAVADFGVGGEETNGGAAFIIDR